MRTVHTTDTAALIDLFERLSPRSRYYRFLGPKKVLSADELENLTDIDHIEREALALIAPDGRFIAVARYESACDDPKTAEVALTVADEWQGHGIGSAMASLLIAKARRHRFARLRAMTLAENYPSRKLLRHLGFTVYRVDGAVMSLDMQLAGPMAEVRRGPMTPPSPLRKSRTAVAGNESRSQRPARAGDCV